MSKTIYGVLIQTDATSEFRAIQGWDDAHATKTDAESCASRARKNWHGAKVVEMTEDEARENGWIS